MDQPSTNAPPVQTRPPAVTIPVLLLSIGLLVLGNGLQGTLLGVRAGIEGMPTESIGLLMSAYFVGYVLGSVLLTRLVEAVGHIRSFAALASITSAVVLTYVLLVSPLAWTLLRIVHGACYAGLVIVAESWLNSATDRRHRGRVLAVYHIVIMAAWAASQQFLGLASPAGFTLFLLVSILISLALVPITLARVTLPGVVASSRLGLARLYAISPLGLAGVFVVGLCSGAFFGMGPTFAYSLGLGDRAIAAFMGATMIGALTLQWPLGWLSDQFDRRKIVIAAAVLALGVDYLLAGGRGHGLPFLLSLAFLFGGLVFPAYSVCVAHVNDHIDARDLLAAASGLILVYGAGSAIGPFAASLFMGRIGPAGLYWFAGIAEAVFIVFAVYRLTRRGAILKGLKTAFVSLPRTSHVAVTLDKRTPPTPPPGRQAPE